MPRYELFRMATLIGSGKVDDFHPMKGPMTTQTLRGLTNSGAMHWRGDRSNGLLGIDPFDIAVVTADTDLRLARYFGLSEGFFLGLQMDYDLMQRRREIDRDLKTIRPRAA